MTLKIGLIADIQKVYEFGGVSVSTVDNMYLPITLLRVIIQC